MGTCMSKEKKSPPPAPPTSLSASCSYLSDSSSSQSELNPVDDCFLSAPRRSNADEKCKSSPIPIIGRPSPGEESREVASTDKHVVEIRLPVASPNKFRPSPGSATLAAKAMAAIARPAAAEREETTSEDDADGDDGDEDYGEHKEEEDEEEVEDETSLASIRKLRRKRSVPSPPLFYPKYMGRVSFSRDLAALSRDLTTLSSSALCRSPSVNGAHEIIAAAIRAAHSPHNGHAKSYAFEEYSTTTRSRSLPKRFYSKGGDPNASYSHKRSSSRDGVSEFQKSMKRGGGGGGCPDPSVESRVSPRLFSRREEASGEYRVYARQVAARKGHDASSKAPTAILSRKKERSPLRRSSTGKVADAERDVGYLPEDENFEQVNASSKHNHLKNRTALRERTANCPTNWSEFASQDRDLPSKPHKNVPKPKIDEDLESIEDRLYEAALSTVETVNVSTVDSCIRLPAMPYVAPKESSDALGLYPGSMDRICSIIEALADINMESSLLSEIEESETEFESEIEILQSAFNVAFSPRKEKQAQQARNILLKEAAMDAFARPSFYSDLPKEDQQDCKASPGLATLMAMKLTDTEADTLKIRKVLKLLSVAESELGKEQKLVFYSQLRTVLDSVKPSPAAQQNKSPEETERSESLNGKVLTSRANSWPRSLKEPVHAVSTLCDQSQNTMLCSDSGVDQTPVKTQVDGKDNGGLESTVERIESDKDHPELLAPPKKDVNLNAVRVESDIERCNSLAHLAEEYLKTETDYLPTSSLPPSHEFVCKPDIPQIYGGTISGIDHAQEKLIDPVLVNGFHQHFCEDNLTSSNVDGSTVVSTSLPLDVDGKSSMNMKLHSLIQPMDQASNGTSSKIEPETVKFEDHHIGLSSESCEAVRSKRKMQSSKSSRCDDGASDTSFEFRVKSPASTPHSTPSTPMISSTSTPRHIRKKDLAFSADEIAEIWEAFE